MPDAPDAPIDEAYARAVEDAATIAENFEGGAAVAAAIRDLLTGHDDAPTDPL